MHCCWEKKKTFWFKENKPEVPNSCYIFWNASYSVVEKIFAVLFCGWSSNCWRVSVIHTLGQYICTNDRFIWFFVQARYFSNDKTFYVLKVIWIFLKSQIKFRNLKIQFRWEEFLFCLKIYFKHGPYEVVPCVHIKLYHVKNLNTSTWHHSSESIFEIDFQRG